MIPSSAEKSGCNSTQSCWVMLATLISKRVLPSLAEMRKCTPHTCIEFQYISMHFRCLCIAYDLGDESIMHRTGKSSHNIIFVISFHVMKFHDVWQEFPEVLRSCISLCLWQGSDSHWKGPVQLRVTLYSVSRRHAQVLGSNGLAPSVRALKALVWGTMRNYSTVGYCRYIFVCAALCI